MGWIKNFFQRRALRKNLKKLWTCLRKRYGRKKYYTYGQINTAMAHAYVPGTYSLHAYALFMEIGDNDPQAADIWRSPDFETARQEVADTLFSGDIGFDSYSNSTSGLFDDGSDGSFSDGGGFGDGGGSGDGGGGGNGGG